MDIYSGCIQKLKGVLREPLGPVCYSLPVGETELVLNPLLGSTLHLKFTGQIFCIACHNRTQKSFNQGYCFPCAKSLARCDLCIVRPEKCHYHLGTCREPVWGETHCFIPHVVYLANTSGLKVGITRESQIPTRWIDQGAVEALPIFTVQNRLQSGLIEVWVKNYFQDKTDWRKMLKGKPEKVDLLQARDTLLKKIEFEQNTLDNSDLNLRKFYTDAKVTALEFPVLQYPDKVVSLNLEKTSEITGTLLGIKGQYLLLDSGALNIRNLSGYEIILQVS